MEEQASPACFFLERANKKERDRYPAPGGWFLKSKSSVYAYEKSEIALVFDEDIKIYIHRNIFNTWRVFRKISGKMQILQKYF